MLDLIAFYESRAGTTTLQNVAGLADNHCTVSGDNITVPDICRNIVALMAWGATGTSGQITQVQIASPSLRATSLLDVGSWGIAATPGNEPPMEKYMEYPIPLVSGEALQALTANSGTNTEAARVGILLTDGVLANPYPNSRIESIRATGATTVTANAWSTCPLTFQQQLRAGTYAVVGMKAVGTTMGLARLIFGNQGPRPGCFGQATMYSTLDTMDRMFRYGRLGVWGVFSHINPPQLEVFCSSADTAQEIILDVIKIA